MSDKSLIVSFPTCLGLTGLGVWLGENWAALVSSCCAILTLVIHWFYRHKQHTREQANFEAEQDEHRNNSV